MEHDFPETRDSLIVQLQDPLNREAWDQFASIYRPVIYRLARRKGLQDADAQDLAQQVLISVSLAIGRWEKSDHSVRFRHWLRRVARNAILNALSRMPRDRATGGTDIQQFLQRQADSDPESESQIELEYRRELFLVAAKTVRVDVQPATWQAFEMTVVQGHSAQDAATQLNRSIGTIYTACSRVMRRIREAVKQLEQQEL